MREMKLETLSKRKGKEGTGRLTGELQGRQKHREYTVFWYPAKEPKAR